MTIREARKEIIQNIIAIYDKSEADNIAEIALEHITGLSRTERASMSTSLSSKQEKLLSQTIGRLGKHEPIQYIINQTWFAGMKFYVDKNVLIPRPETEELVEWVISDFRFRLPDSFIQQPIPNLKSNSKFQISNFRFLDVGTGSGCIAIALKTKLPQVEMWACDVSDEALNVARMNADTLHATIDFVPLNFLDKNQQKQLPNVDIIVSNPPYVPQQDKNEMKRNVLDFEPETALFVPDNDALVFYRAIADFGKKNLNEKGIIYVEIHENLGASVKDLFESKGYNAVEVRKDLQGKDRIIKACSN